MTPRSKITPVNKELRHQIKALMKERGISQEQLAEQISMRRTNLNQMLNADTDIPQRWQDVFQALGKKLVLVDVDANQEEERPGASSTL